MRQAASDHVHVRLSALDCFAGLQTRDYPHEAGTARSAGLGSEGPRHPELHIWERRRELRWHHSDYGVRLAVESDGLPQDSWVATERPQPNRVAQHDNTTLTPLLFARSERPTECGLGAEDFKEIR